MYVAESPLEYSMLTEMRNVPGSLPTPEFYDRMIAVVQTAERAGFRTCFTCEHHGVADGHLPAQLPMLAALARETETIRLGTGVILLPLTQFRRVVQEACVVDQLSNGRLTVGVGIGSNPRDFEVYDVDVKSRGRLMEEGLEILRAGFRGERLPDGYPVNVPPVQKPLPLLGGAMAPRAIDRTVRLTDGLFAYAHVDAEQIAGALYDERVAPALAAHGRTPDDFHLSLLAFCWPSGDWEEEWREYVAPGWIYQQRCYAMWAGDGEVTEGVAAGSYGGAEGSGEKLRDEAYVASKRAVSAAPPYGLGEYEDPARLEALRERLIVGPPEECAERIKRLRRAFPFAELVMWPTLPGIPAELSEKCIRTFADEVAPVVNEGLV